MSEVISWPAPVPQMAGQKKPKPKSRAQDRIEQQARKLRAITEQRDEALRERDTALHQRDQACVLNSQLVAEINRLKGR